MGAGLEFAAGAATAPPCRWRSPSSRCRGSGFIAAFIRDITVRRRLQERLQANNDLVTALLAGSDAEETHHLVAHLARRLLNARICWFGALDEDAGTWTVLASSGDGAVTDAAASPLPAAALVGPPGPVVLDHVVAADLVLPGADAKDLGPVLSVHVHVQEVAVGLLVFAAILGRRRIREPRHRDRVAVRIHDRIGPRPPAGARRATRAADHRRSRPDRGDLHDTVIQRIFAGRAAPGVGDPGHPRPRGRADERRRRTARRGDPRAAELDLQPPATPAAAATVCAIGCRLSSTSIRRRSGSPLGSGSAVRWTRWSPSSTPTSCWLHFGRHSPTWPDTPTHRAPRSWSALTSCSR